jgi:tetratricopeptide (TPR) repeat protein
MGLAIWNPATGEKRVEERQVRGHGRLSWSPDGKQLACGCGEQAHVRDAFSLEEIQVLAGHPTQVYWVAWSLDGQRLASLSGEGYQMITIWQPSTGEKLLRWHGDQSSNYCGAWSHDGRYVATTGWCSVKIWDSTTGEEVASLRGHSGHVFSVAFSPDGTRLASGDEYQKVIVWDVTTWRALHWLRGHAGKIHSVAWSPDSSRLATASGDETIKIWDPATGQEVVTLREHKGAHKSVAWSPDGRRLATASDEGTIKIWDASAGYELAAMPTDWSQRRQDYACSLAGGGRYGEALAVFQNLVDEFPEVSEYRNALDIVTHLMTESDALRKSRRAWALATCVDSRFRDADRAVEVAKKAVQLLSQEGACWNTLGVAQYRAGHWKEAITALQKSIELQGDDSWAFFFLAMAHWQLGHKEEARRRYDKAVEWMEKNRPEDEELLRFRGEAVELLDITDKPKPKDDARPSGEKDTPEHDKTTDKPEAEALEKPSGGSRQPDATLEEVEEKEESTDEQETTD